MNYELAKQLKDAGFELRGCEYAYVETEENGFEGHLGHCAYCSQPAIIIGDRHMIIPTLSELIEACGDGFHGLQHSKAEKDWCAYSQKEDERGQEITGYGETPEEAVAKLWLKLQEHV